MGTTLSDGQTLFVAKISDDLIGIATIRVGLGTTGTFVGGHFNMIPLHYSLDQLVQVIIIVSQQTIT